MSVIEPIGQQADDGLPILEASERLLLSLLRRWLEGATRGDYAEWQAAWNEAAAVLGPEPARAVLAAMERTIRRVALHADGRVTYHKPCCRCVGADEMTLLQLVARGQRRIGPRPELLAALLVAPAGVAPVAEAAMRLGEALLACGQALPLRELERLQAARPEAPASVSVLH
ncbi:hypothetical protein SAMN06265365_101217 [Tistlia consotensis]|uniref:Uncharacterized protein n=1 Tax=Tistlia consotensis USBA 355 TaxID=560819 RepID=A0A1Y6B7N8_9PROT|nr:hypothetical protein [Tistlia consotensis]SME89479.1 hypothetical protein SAMN05428998_101215 [Tistlia consotensis USBA 355]SNR26008.1 hypothetical protein SAMN06265365_101217 [Tistlia consotensis]